MLDQNIVPKSVPSGNIFPTRKTAFICTNYLAERELLRYEVIMQIVRKKTVFEWVLSDPKMASVALLEPSNFVDHRKLPADCICIWIGAADIHSKRKEDLTLSANFGLGELINVLDRAALRVLDLKSSKSNSIDSLHRSKKTYCISKWINLPQNFFTTRFQKILVLMTKRKINWDWLLTDGGLTEREAFLFLDELRKHGVLVEQHIEPIASTSAKEVFVEPRVIGGSSLVKKITQWLRKARSSELGMSQ